MNTLPCLLGAALAAAVIPAFAQIPEPVNGGVVMGHHHVLVSEADYDAHRRLWIDALGARTAMLGSMEVLLLPDTIILLRKREPQGGSEGTSLNHIAFLVRDLAATEARWRAAGGEVTDRRPSPAQLFVRFPGGLSVELIEDPKLAVPAAHHHIHFYTASPEQTRDWYAKTFGAKPGMRGRFLAADMPGANLSFSQAEGVAAGTKGRALDHTGFEVDGLEEFCRRLEASGVKLDAPYRQLPQYGIAIAFLTDPWGTYIELTEGLDKLR